MKERVKGACVICGMAAKVEHTCVTCEKIHAKDPAHEIFSYKGCRKHAAELLRALKRHALTEHPVNLLGAIAAQLKGEDVLE